MNLQSTPRLKSATMEAGVILEIAGEQFKFRFCDDSPRSCGMVRQMLPLNRHLVHARWSGEACWIPLGNLGHQPYFENATSYPAPGEILFYPGGTSEAELLIPYGPTQFACMAGTLAGNPVLKLISGHEDFADLCRRTLRYGAQEIRMMLSCFP